MGRLTPPVIGAVLLAAGAARRMGAAKLALPWRGRPLVSHAIAPAREAGLPLILVLGAHAARLRPLAEGYPVVVAARAGEGMALSLAAGIAAVPADWQGVLVLLGDMPAVMPATLGALRDALAAGADAVVPTFRGQRGNPAGFARRLFPDLLALEGDRGARALLDRLGDRLARVPVADPGILLDIDTPEDLARG